MEVDTQSVNIQKKILKVNHQIIIYKDLINIILCLKSGISRVFSRLIKGVLFHPSKTAMIARVRIVHFLIVELLFSHGDP